MSEWISVKDRLPERNGEYLVLKTIYGHAYYEIACYSNSYDGFDADSIPHGKQCFYGYDSEAGDFELRGVTHWMELPEPPKEKNNAEE